MTTLTLASLAAFNAAPHTNPALSVTLFVGAAVCLGVLMMRRKNRKSSTR